MPSPPHAVTLMTKCVCIDTTPQSHRAVRGHIGPAGGQFNDKVNERDLDPGMLLWAVTGIERRQGRQGGKGTGRDRGGEGRHLTRCFFFHILMCRLTSHAPIEVYNVFC